MLFLGFIFGILSISSFFVKSSNLFPKLPELNQRVEGELHNQTPYLGGVMYIGCLLIILSPKMNSLLLLQSSIPTCSSSIFPILLNGINIHSLTFYRAWIKSLLYIATGKLELTNVSCLHFHSCPSHLKCSVQHSSH